MAAQADADDSFSQMSTKALKRMLEGLGVSTATCCERGDLLKLAEGNPGAADEGVRPRVGGGGIVQVSKVNGLGDLHVPGPHLQDNGALPGPRGVR